MNSSELDPFLLFQRMGVGCKVYIFDITNKLSLCQFSQWLKEGEAGLTPALATFVKKICLPFAY